VVAYTKATTPCAAQCSKNVLKCRRAQHHRRVPHLSRLSLADTKKSRRTLKTEYKSKERKTQKTTMTKKDYILISRVFNTTARIWLDARKQWRAKQDDETDEVKISEIDDKIDGINKILALLEVIVKGLSHELAKDNPKFDAAKFAVACGLSEFRVNQPRVNKKVADELDNN